MLNCKIADKRTLSRLFYTRERCIPGDDFLYLGTSDNPRVTVQNNYLSKFSQYVLTCSKDYSMFAKEICGFNPG